MTEDEFRAIGTPLEARVLKVMGGEWFDLAQGGFEICLDGWFTADKLRALADALEGKVTPLDGFPPGTLELDKNQPKPVPLPDGSYAVTYRFTYRPEAK